MKYSIVIIWALWGISLNPPGLNAKNDVIELKDGWEYVWTLKTIKSQEIQKILSARLNSPPWKPYRLFTIPKKNDGREILWIRRKLPAADVENPYLFIFFPLAKKEVYIDDMLVLKPVNDDINSQKKVNAPYKALPYIKLDKRHLGKIISIKLYNPEHKKLKFLGEAWYGSKTSLYIKMLKKDLDRIMLGLFFIITGLLLIFTYKISPDVKEIISFCLTSLSMGIYMLFQNSTAHVFFDYSVAALNIGLFSMFLTTMFIGIYIERVFGPGYKNIIRRMWQLQVIHALAFLFVVAVFNPYLFVSLKYLYPFFIVTGLSIIITFHHVLKSALKGSRNAKIIFGGLAFYFLTGLHDILVGLQIIPYFYLVIHWGMFVLIMCLAFVFYRRLSESKNRLERYSKELKDYSENLEHRVDERTKELSEKQKDYEEAKAYFEAVFYHNPLAITIVDQNGFIVNYNKALEKLFKLDGQKILGQNLLKSQLGLDASIANLTRDCIDYNLPQREIKHVTVNEKILNYSVAPLIIGSEVTGAVGVFDDDTRIVLKNRELETTLIKLKDMQNHIIMQEKMASLGKLTAGIAHEIKNPLNFISNFAKFTFELAEELKDMIKSRGDGLNDEYIDKINETLENIEQYTEKIVNHSDKADSIVKGMLLHSRGKAGDKQVTDINRLLEENVKLAYHGMRAKDNSFTVEIDRDYRDGLRQIAVVQQNISRVMLNLLDNAFYSVNIKRKELGGDYKARVKVSTDESNGFLVIKIWDNGLGVEDSIKDQLFNPFFSTKPVEHGTGLGLSISYDIVVQEHQGKLSLSSKAGEYAEFTLLIPVG